ncbi:hypothetical protein BCR43DRAFT_168355 [Syncephalastrum racemosum]|uniref:DNA topoisomerase n=1 Tax=Syncephalastrum racemosum TaxID=13706 RepID=A0A1X2HP01_SYNRA|nr:hypothetical protein BCR43DRAFT_168355 [Syncephalastrum racemosum]
MLHIFKLFPVRFITTFNCHRDVLSRCYVNQSGAGWGYKTRAIVEPKWFVQKEAPSPASKTMRILCVAEKNSAAKAIAGLLSSNNFRAERSNAEYIMNYSFDYTFENRPSSIIMTSVRGHITDHIFRAPYDKFGEGDPIDLFHAPIHVVSSYFTKF